MVFHAGSEALTRTSLAEGNAVVWERGDAISLFDPSRTNNKFTTEDSGESAAFSGTVSVDGGPYYALYPYDGNAEIDGSVISTVLPAVQTARAGGFASGLNPAVARADENEMLYFRNACPIVKFTLGGSAAMVVRAVLQGNLGESLVGGDCGRRVFFRSLGFSGGVRRDEGGTGRGVRARLHILFRRGARDFVRGTFCHSV